MTNWRLWLHWSWRDLRVRWLQVAAIALIIALGTGVFAGLSGQKTWRIDSNNLSYGRLHMYDLKLTLAGGSYLNGDEFLAVLRDVAATAAREIWCLGDLVGYGADPNDCVRLVRDNAAVCLAGNHDLGVTGAIPLHEFSPGADGGTEVTESFRLADSVLVKIWRPLGGFLREKRNRRDMLRTLERVKAAAEA